MLFFNFLTEMQNLKKHVLLSGCFYFSSCNTIDFVEHEKLLPVCRPKNTVAALTRDVRFSSQVEIPLAVKYTRGRSAMDVPLLKQFVSWRGDKRIVIV